MNLLFIDIETYSSVDLKKSGVYPYTESPDFEILLFGYAFNDEPIEVVDFAQGEKLSSKVLTALYDDRVIKVAHNAAFEIACLNTHYGKFMDKSQWADTMIMAYYLSLPGSLDAVSKILRLDETKQSSGKMLINYFSKPCTPTRVNNQRTRNQPGHDLEKWQLYKEYNKQDVETERAIYKKLESFMPPIKIWQEWVLDQKINDRGVSLDTSLIDSALYLSEKRVDELTEEAKKLTGLDNPNSPAQLKSWISELEGEEITSIAKTANLEVADPKSIRMLDIRSELGKSSLKKYETMKDCICNDGRARGLIQFYGASRTGRWAGRLIQVQNLPRNYLKDLDETRKLVKRSDYELLTMLYDSPIDALSQLIRTAFVPEEGNKFIIADYSAIEARVVSWLAHEMWQVEVFKTTGKIYEATASQMFKIPMDQITKDLRQRGKVASLALGYQGASNALIKLGALNMGISEDELPGIVNRWRSANPNIVKLWKDAENCTRQALLSPGVDVKLPQNLDIVFNYAQGLLSIYLPSGRRLIYFNAKISSSNRISYDGYANDEGKKTWGRVDTYGGKLVENIVQAIARDCLSIALTKLDEAGYAIVMHIHDEVVIDATNEQKLEDVLSIMGEPIDWAKGLYLTADGFESEYYMKD